MVFRVSSLFSSCFFCQVEEALRVSSSSCCFVDLEKRGGRHKWKSGFIYVFFFFFETESSLCRPGWSAEAVSYTHLTLPTILRVGSYVGGGSFKKKKKRKRDRH